MEPRDSVLRRFIGAFAGHSVARQIFPATCIAVDNLIKYQRFVIKILKGGCLSAS